MAKRYIVLEAASGQGTLRRGGRVLSADPEALRDVQIAPRIATLSAREVNEARRVPEVLGTAPIMPVTVVRPKALKAGEEADAPDIGSAAWGVDAVGATRSKFSGAGVTVAILDSGIDAAHEAFRGKPIVQKDFTGEGDGDVDGHGTHCAGTVFGGEVKGLRIGVAPGVSKALIGKVLDHEGSGSTEQIIDGLMWALREGANVVSMSIGFDFPAVVRELIEKEGLELEPATSQALAAYRDNVRLFDALAALVRAHSSMFANAIVIAAAGNESDRPRYEIATAPPANADGFISVGALQKKRGAPGHYSIARFSNGVPIVAGPGVAIRSAKSGGGLASMSGTSMATPHVAGVAALWLEAIRARNARASIHELEGRLIGRAIGNVIPDADDRPNGGSGLIQAPLD